MTTKVDSARAKITSTGRLYVSLVGGAWRAVTRGGWKLFAVMLTFYVVMVAVASPLLSWLFREALRANGMVAVDLGTFSIGRGAGWSLLLLMLLATIAFWLASLQFIVVVVMLRRAQKGLAQTAKSVWGDVVRVFKKLLRPSSYVLALYMFVVLPLTGFGFVDTLASHISVPQFISGELMKDTSTAVAWVLLMVALAVVNIKFALCLPIFASTKVTGAQAMKLSWRFMKLGPIIALVAAVATVLLGAGLGSGVVLALVVFPTYLADLIAPNQAPLTAAFGFGLAHVLVAFLVSAVTIAILAIALVLTEREVAAKPGATAKPGAVELQALTPSGPAHVSGAVVGWVVGVIAVVAAGGIGFSHVTLMENMASAPETLILGHRGYVAGGVENTISALEAASEAGVDMVEMDVMQTADGQFVVIHDATLGRLAGINARVGDLTLEELNALTVHDHSGHSDTLPTLEEYVLRAKELDMPLLIEIKMGGLDTDDHVELLIDELERLDALEGNIFHTLDHQSVETLKALRPNVTVGYIMPFAGEGLPETSADFIVVEEWTATSSMQNDAAEAGLGFFVWTVDEGQRQREKLRRGVDAIITDTPLTALAAREQMQEEKGFAYVLLDVVRGFLVF